MSAINTGSLKSVSDPLISFITKNENIGTSQIRHDTLLEFAKITKAIKIVNNDVANNITYRTNSPSDVLKTVPPNSDEIVEGWTSYIEINPNAVTGSGSLEIDLVDPKEAYINGK